jgi:hypothetical protein
MLPLAKRTRDFAGNIIRCLCMLFLISNIELNAQTVAFPGAEGFGRFATGGRGGKVIEVTNLNDQGAGSLRAAITTSGPRTIVFRVSGTIVLKSYLKISKGDLTIAGQTAPGDGICLRNYTFRSEADNVIIRYIRSRLGDSTKLADDAFSGNGSTSHIFRKIIIDHCSISWALDENASWYDNAEFTMQWCYITESLYHSYHPKGDHGYGGMWGGWRASFHHNLLAHNSSRNPRFNGSRYTGQPDSEIVDFRNNVIYNWAFNSAYGGEAGNHNIVGNYYKYGPGTNASSVRGRIIEPYDTASNWHIADNYVWGYDNTTANNWLGVQGTYAAYQNTKQHVMPFPYDSVITNTSAEAYELVLSKGGCNFPKRDTLDSRIANEARTQTATYGGAWGANRGIIDSQDQVGGWPELNSLPAPADSDHDGIPDDWENDHGLNPADSLDGAIITGDGYSKLEHYLNSLVEGNTTAVEPINQIPTSYSLGNNYPNPFNPGTWIEYMIPARSHVKIEVLNLLGVPVAKLSDSELEAGSYKVRFDGSKFSSGVYFYRLQSGKFAQTRKMLLLK